MGIKNTNNMMGKYNNYSNKELLACMGSRVLEDGKSVFVGTGLPIIAAMLAQKMHAPQLLIVFEAGGVGPIIQELPISVGDSRTLNKALMCTNMQDIMSLAQAGYVEFGFLGAAQMDAYGNINTTTIGNHDIPTVRLPGSGGANDVGSFTHRTIIIMSKQSQRTFVNKLDFLTTPGYLSGPGAREKKGLPAGTGPYRVVTQLGTYGFDEVTKRVKLLSLNPGVSLEKVKENSGFEILVSEMLSESTPPSEKELEILRTDIDPMKMVIGE